MAAYLNPPLTARNGRTLKVLLPSRVSSLGPGKQDKRSLDDQEDIQRRWLNQHTDLPLDINVIAGSGSGEILERKEYQELLELIESEEYDLVLTEDLGRIVRRVYAFFVCELCEDHDVRLIAINNHNVDTAKPGWRDAAFFVSYFYEKDNSDKSARLKERLRSRFLSGGALPGIVYGYIKPPNAKSDEDIQKAPDAEPIYKEWFRKLDEEEATYAEIADWLNSKSVSVGATCQKKEKWDGTLVGQTTHNWLLKGVRFRNKRKSRRINKSGKYKSEKAPAEDLLLRRVPHLAFFDEAYYDRVIAKVDERNAKYRRTGDNGEDPRRNVPKKRTRFPGQSVYCGVCGRLYVFGGHGRKEHLMCTGAREHKCWNGITFDGKEACARLSSLIYNEIETLPAFEPDFLAMLREEITQRDSLRSKQLRDLEKQEQRNERELKNVVAAVRKRGDSRMLLDDLDRLEKESKDLTYRRREIEAEATDTVVVPSVEVVKHMAREEFERLSRESHEFARLMRQLIPEIYVFPFRLCDGGDVVLRAWLEFTAVPFLPREAQALGGLTDRLTKHFRVDLFDPPQREEFRERVVQSRLNGQKEYEVAAELSITKTAAQRAAALQRKMDQLGITDPWGSVVEPPFDYNRLRRHKHERYRFEPLDGFPLKWPR